MRKAVWAVVLMMLGGTPVMAADMLPGVVVTAERMGVPRKEEPQAVEVITEKDFQRLGAGNVSEALAGALSLDLSAGAQNSTSAMGGHQVQLRGMNTNHTLILVDGRRLADEDTSQTQNMYLLDRINLSTVDRIEILRGPAGAMYGSDAMGGVIQIITKKPGRREAEAGYRLSSRENETHFRIDPGALGRFSLSFDGRLTKYRPASFRREGMNSIGSRADGYDVPSYGNARHVGMDGAYDFENANHNLLRFHADYFHEKTYSRFADTFRTITMRPGRTITFPEFQNRIDQADRTEWNTGLSYEGDTGRNAYFLQTYYSRLDKKSKIFNAGSLWGHDQAYYEKWALEGRNTLSLASHQLTVGGEFQKSTYTGTRLGDMVGSTQDERGYELHTGAFYLSDFWTVGRKWVLVPSVRFERGNRYGFVGTPRLGVTYNINDHGRLKANYGKGFRAPTVSELYLNMDSRGGHPVSVYGNPDLVPEKSQNFDAGLEWEWKGTQAKISYFHSRVKNLIDTEGGADTHYIYRYLNRSRVAVQGIEAELSHTLGTRWTAKAGYTYLDAQDRSIGSRLENRARHQMTVSLDYDDGAPYGWSGKLWDTFEDSYYFDSQNYTYHLLNLSLQKHWGKALTFSAGLYNIGNKKVDDLYVDGREWFCGMEMKW